MALSLIIGPAHAGKVASLLEQYRTALADERDPWLIVPRRADVMRVERELAGSGALVGGRVATFDGLFERLAGMARDESRTLGSAARLLVVRRLLTQEGFASLARFPGFADALVSALDELDGIAAPGPDIGPVLGEAFVAYRAEIGRLGLQDRGDIRRRGLARLTGVLDAWDGAPVFAYGFEDLTALQLGLLEALAARGEVVVSLPYEPGRAAYASLTRTMTDLAALARGGAIEEQPAGATQHLPAAIAHLERELFADSPVQAPLDGAIRFLEAAGARGVCDLVAEEVLHRLRDGTPAEQIGIVVPSVDLIRAPLAAACAALGVPLAVEAREPLRATSLGRSLLSLLRFAWLDGERPDLYAHLRTPFSGVGRSEIDHIEGQLRGRAVRTHRRTIELTAERRAGRALPTLDLATAGGDPVEAVRVLADRLVTNAHGLGAHPVGVEAASDLRALAAIRATLDELAVLGAAGEPISRVDVVHALDHAEVPADRPGAQGRVALLDLSGARTRAFAVVIVVGLEQGTLPRAGRATPLLDDDLRARLDEQHGTRLTRPDAAARDRYLFLTACTRARTSLVLAREAATADGTSREPGPFWDAVCELYDPDEVRRATVRRPLSAITREVREAPTERERLRSLAALSVAEPTAARAIAVANGWERRLDRARTAFVRSTAITQPAALEILARRETWAVSALDRHVTCSSAWFVEKWLTPGRIDRGVDRMLQGTVAHGALQRFYQSLPSVIPGAERVTPENLAAALALARDCLDKAVAANVADDIDDLDRRTLAARLQRDIERLVRSEAASASTFVPRQLEQKTGAFVLAPGVAISGKIDRVDVDPMSARGLVVDYKLGGSSTAADIERDSILQVPLYMLVLRDKLGLEPMGGVYVPVEGGPARGMLRDEDGRVEGFKANDYLDPERFDGLVEAARTTAIEAVGRIRAGDVRHDPRGGQCPDWCTLWRMCRKARA